MRFDSDLRLNSDHLDVDFGLQMVEQNFEVYQRLIGRFLKTRTSFLQELDVAIQNNSREIAMRSLHTLKGIAANIGAKKLSTLSQMLEDELKQGTYKTDLYSVFASELEAVLQQIANFLDRSTGVSLDQGSLSDNEYRGRLDSLQHLISSHDVASFDAINDLLKFELPDDKTQNLRTVASYLEELNYTEALKALRRIMH